MESRESSYSEKLGLGARLCVAVRKLVRNFHSGCKFFLAAFSRENSEGGWWEEGGPVHAVKLCCPSGQVQLSRILLCLQPSCTSSSKSVSW